MSNPEVSDKMRNLKKVLIVILCVLIAFLCVIMGMALRGGGWTSASRGNILNKNYKLVLEKEIEPEGITKLNIQYGMNSNSVYFYENEGENIIIREYLNFEAKEEQLSTVEQKASELLIKGKRRNSFSFLSLGNNGGGYIEIWLPADFKAGLSAATLSGDIRAEQELAWGDIFRVSTTSGDVYFPGVEADEIKASTTSGDITLEQAAGKRVEASTTSGDIRLGQVEGGVWASGTSGDVHILGGEGERNVSTVSGDIRLEGINGSFDLSTTSGDISVEEAKSYGSANTVSGDVSISFDELEGNLDIETTSGEVALRMPAKASFTLHFSSASGEADTFFDDALSFNKRRTQADGAYGSGSNKITVSTVSGDLRITEL